MRLGRSVILTTDASPYGIGAILNIEGKVVAHFSEQISRSDRDILGLSAEPSSRDQQVLEAFAILLSLHEFAQHWRTDRVTLTIRTDNIAALTMCARMQPHSQQLGIIARELALDICEASYSPDIVEHIPGISNIGADALSRICQPGKTTVLPRYLLDDTRHVCTPRDKSWWRSLEQPA